MNKYKIKFLKDGKEVEKVVHLDSFDKEQLPLNVIEITELKNSRFEHLKRVKIKQKDLNLLFYELSLMTKAHIPLNEAFDILLKNRKDKNILKFIEALKYSFSNAKPLEEVLKGFNIDNLVLAFLHLCQKTGNINDNLVALHTILSKNEEIKSRFLKAISYPIVLLIGFFISMFVIFSFVIPKFKSIFVLSKDLPLATNLLLYIQNIFETYGLWILASIIFIAFLFCYFYKFNKNFNSFVEEIVTSKLFLIKDIYLNMQLYKLFLALDIMQTSKYEFYKSLINAKVLLKNKYILDKIESIDYSLQNGKGISESFSETNLVDDIVLNLLNTGDITNSLEITIKDIKDIYKKRFEQKVDLLISFIQPIFLVSMMLLILWIILGLFVPIWDMGSIIKDM